MGTVFVSCCINHCELSGLTQHTLSYSSEGQKSMQSRFQCAKMKMLARLHSFQRLKERVCPYLFQLLEAACVPWLVAPFKASYSLLSSPRAVSL
jgi:hypothetical protein